jgi:hypothetical protein
LKTTRVTLRDSTIAGTERLKAMQLFDNFERLDCEPRRHDEGMFDFLNRSGWVRSQRIRESFEKWFGHYPEEHAKDIWSRFRSKDTYPYYTALFELVLHELMRRAGTVTVHPKAYWGTSSRVDFRVDQRGGIPFLLEAVTHFGQSEAEQGADMMVEALCNAVNEVESPDFWLHMRVDGKARQQPSSKKLKRFLKDKLQTLKQCVLSGQEAFQKDALSDDWVYEAHGLTLTFTWSPKSPELRGKSGVRTLGARSGAFKWCGLVEDLRQQLRKKAKKYGVPPHPLVIAVNVLDWSYQGHQELAQALFGTVREVVRLSWSSEELGSPPLAQSGTEQIQDGLLFDGRQAHYQEISGVLVFDGIAASTLGVVTSRLFLNPWATHQLAIGLEPFPRSFARDGKLVHEEGKSICELLELPFGWPGREEE